MNQNHSLVSVIVPVFNGRQFIGEALESILQQNLPAHEIVVVDDGSTDGTGEEVKKYFPKIIYIHQKNQGTGKARNVGINKTHGNFIAHLDADDIWTKDKLEAQMEAFYRDNNLDIVGAYMKCFFTPGLNKELKEKIQCPEEPLPSFSASAIVVKRQSYQQVGLYETHRKVGQDLSWFILAREKGLKEKIIPKVLVQRRLHASNSGIVDSSEGIARVHILKEALDRRRKAENSGNGHNSSKTQKEK